MTEQKQIYEMAKELCHAPTCEVKKNGGTCYKYCKAYIYAFRAINAGYRKRVDGEWTYSEDKKTMKCTRCRLRMKTSDVRRFCPNCGAKMKGDEGK